MARDFRNKKFQKVLRGYSDAEVDAYLIYINEEYGKLERAKIDSDRKLKLALQKMDAMNSAIEEQNRNLAELTGMEPERAAAMQQAGEERKRQAEEAERNRAQAEELLGEAEEKLAQAEQIRAEAMKNAEEILAAARAEAAAAKEEEEEARRTAQSLYGEVCSFRDALFGLYNAHIESVEEIGSRAEEFLGLVDANGDFGEADDPGEPAEEAAEETEMEPADLVESVMSSFEPTVERTADGDLFLDLNDGGDFTELTDEEEPAFDEEEISEESVDAREEAAEQEEEGSRQPYALGELLRKNRSGADREKKSNFSDLDILLSQGNDSASDDEFNKVYGGDSSRSVDEISRQPMVAPEEPTNPKKHTKF